MRIWLRVAATCIAVGFLLSCLVYTSMLAIPLDQQDANWSRANLPASTTRSGDPKAVPIDTEPTSSLAPAAPRMLTSTSVGHSGASASTNFSTRYQQSNSSLDHTSFATTISEVAASMGVQRAEACLRLTSPKIHLKYPSDAEEHFEEIRRVMSRWTKGGMHCERPWMRSNKGYCGPWVENAFISYFGRLWDKRKNGTRLHDIFGPYIPLLIPWIDRWVTNNWHYPGNMINDLRKVLRRNVAYVTVSQNDEGLPGKNEFNTNDFPNLLVLSAGGYGHVPIPLIKGSEPVKQTPLVKDRTLLLSFMGTTSTAPDSMRPKMMDVLKKEAKSAGISDKVYFGKGSNWRTVTANSSFVLCPRGFGRTSYHLFETVQMGRVPIHIYSDTPWLPYGELFKRVGFVTNVAGLPSLFGRLRSMSVKSIEAMEAAVRELRESHFTLSGVTDQIERFLTGRDGAGDLVCQRLPSVVN